MSKGSGKPGSLNLSINENLNLQFINASHAQDLFNLTDRNREYLREWLPWVDFTKSVNDTTEYIKICKDQYNLNNGFQLIIKYNNEVAGILGLHYINHVNKHTEIGYWLGSNYTGKGLMTMSCRKLIDYCFETLNLNRVAIKCASENYRSQKIPVRLGFKKDGILRQEGFLNGKHIDHILYSMLKEEWFSK